MWRLSQQIRNFVGYKVDPEDLNAYRSVIPSSINVSISKNNDHLIARVSEIDGDKLTEEFLVTEADNEQDLIVMVNDLILSYKNVPEPLRPYFKSILKPTGAKSNSKSSLTLVKA